MGSRTRGDAFGYLTPDSTPDERLCRSFSIPNSPEWLGNFMGAIYPLTLAAEWRKYGSLTPEECAATMQVIFDDAFLGGGSCNTVDTPFWDDASDIEDEASDDEQIWYGYVEDASAPAGELTFKEQASIWLFTGLIAVVATPAAAIAFHAIAAPFVLAAKADDLGELIRIVINGTDIVRVDTSGRAGEIIEIPVIPEHNDAGYDILIIKEG